MATRLWMVLRRLGELRAAVGDTRRMLAAEVQEAARREREDPAEAVHEVRLDGGDADGGGDHIATFRGPVPRIGEYVWTDAGAWRVTTVAWWVRSSPRRSSVARACVYVEPLRPTCRPNPGV
jgi:hypothetical protein